MRQQIGEFHPTLSMTRELPWRTQQARALFLNKSETYFLQQRVRQLLAVHLVELRLRIKKIHLARRSLHVDEDAVLRLRREMRSLLETRLRARGRALRGQQA